MEKRRSKGERLERTPVLTTDVAAPAPSEAQLRIRDSAPNARILQGGEGGTYGDKEDGEKQVNHFGPRVPLPPA